jgi:hypothetical protein
MLIIPGERHGLHVIFGSSGITDAMTASLPKLPMPCAIYAAMARGKEPATEIGR